MLVLSRRTLEEIVIGEGADQIVIQLVDVRGDKARLGVTAPRNVRVDRREVYERVVREGGKPRVA